MDSKSTSTTSTQMTDYARLVAEWADVKTKFEAQQNNKDIALAEHLRTRGVDSKKKVNDTIGGGGHKDYLRRITKHTECLKHGTDVAGWLAHATRQHALYMDKQKKQKQTGAGTIRTEVTATVLGGATARAGEPAPPKERKEKKEKEDAIKPLLEALKQLAEDYEDEVRETCLAAITAHEGVLKRQEEARVARKVAKEAKAKEKKEDFEERFSDKAKAEPEAEETLDEDDEEEEEPEPKPEAKTFKIKPKA